MRIVGGQYRGRALAVPDGRTTRPTSDRAREAVFNILTHAEWAPPLEGARVLDLFAGSGALGFEALSRRAAFCLFVETDEDARGAIRDNIETFGCFAQARVHRRDATRLGPRPGPKEEAFNLVFLDPPYRQGLGEKALSGLIEGGWLSPEATIVFERAADEDNFITDMWHEINVKTYGQAQVLFLKEKIQNR